MAAFCEYAGPVKMHAEDLAKIPEGDSFYHLLASPVTIVPGLIYGMSRITAPEHPLPQLDVQNIAPLRCDNLLHYDSIFDVPKHYYTDLVGQPLSVQDLSKIMVRRYAATRGWSLDTIKHRPVALATFTKLGRDLVPQSPQLSSCMR